MRPARARTKILLALAALASAAVAPRIAHADAWQVASFESPAGKPANGLVNTSATSVSARLVIGCEGASTAAWRGVAIWRSDAPASDAESVPVEVSYFGRTPVTETWQRRAAQGGVVVWPRNSENLRRGLAREAATRGHASVTIEIRDPGAASPKLVFSLDGLDALGPELAKACPALTTGAAKRRERGW